MTGSSKLTPEQQAFYLRRFGEVYHHVPDRPPTMPNREARRGNKKRRKRFVR